MKILFVDNGIRGHHFQYFDALNSIDCVEPVLVLPEQCTESRARQYVYSNQETGKRSFLTYLKWLKEIRTIAKKERPDIIHFLYGDLFYRYFGIGLRLFRKYKIVMTIHEVREQKIQIISLRRIFKQITAGVVHSAYMKNALVSHGINKAKHIEYPCFHIRTIKRDDALAFWNIQSEAPVLACIGSTDHYKGLDILLTALITVTEEYSLLIAGMEKYFDKSFIADHIKEYQKHVSANLRYLSDEELYYALNAADFIILPYRKEFHGASGPLAEGVSLGKCIIGTDYGTIGETIRENHLGYTFKPEDSKSLAYTLSNAISNGFVQDNKYKEYRLSLNVEFFIQKYKELYESMLK